MPSGKKPARTRAKKPIQPVGLAADPAIDPTINCTAEPARNPDEKQWDTAKWDNEDNQVLIDILLDERRPGDGKPIGPENATSADGFKTPVWNRAVEKLKGSEKKKIDGKSSLAKSAEN